MSDLYFLIFGIICALVGIICIFAKARAIATCREKVDAIITSITVDKILLRGSTIKTYCPNFSYTIEGKTYEGIAAFNTTDKEKYKKGDKLPIFVNSASPEQYNFRGGYGIIAFGVIALTIGCVFTILYFV